MHYVMVEEIDAPASRVWQVLLDLERWPEWTPTVTSLQRLDDDESIAIGSRVVIRQPHMPRAVWRISAIEPGRRFEWETKAFGITTRADHRVEALPGERARVTVSIDISGLLALLVDLAYGALTRRYLKAEALCLKRRCELTRPTLP